MRKPETLRPLIYLLACMALGYLCYHSLAGGTLLTQSAYNSYALQAQAWLQGRCDLPDGQNYTWLELAVYQGKYYVSFPPLPSVLLLPFVAALGLAAVPGDLIAALLGLLGAAGVYVSFVRRGFSPAGGCLWALISVMGSNLWWLTCSDGVWFLAQNLNFCLVVWGLHFADGDGRPRRTLAAFLLACAVGCRPFSLLYLLAAGLLWLWAEVPRGLRAAVRALWLPVAAAALVGAALGWYNFIRFGSPWQFGHAYLPEFTGAGNEQFALRYLGQNLLQLLRPVTLAADASLQFPLFNGFLFFVANPVFLLGAAGLVGEVRAGRFGLRSGVLLGGFVLGLLALCVHRTMGGWQFGARYTVDLIPYVLAAACGSQRPRRAPRAGEWALCGAAVLFNLYGAVFMLSA